MITVALATSKSLAVSYPIPEFAPIDIDMKMGKKKNTETK